MEKTKSEILDYVLSDPSSEIYLCKNAKTVYDYLRPKGFRLSIEEIKGYLLAQKSAPIRNSNVSERIIGEVSKPFVGKQEFWSSTHGDVAVLSKNRSYNTNERLILVVTDLLSSFCYLEKMKSTSFASV